MKDSVTLSKEASNLDLERPRQLPKHWGERAYNIWERICIRLFTAFVRPQFGSCGKGVIVEPPFRFKNLQYVTLEDEVMIKDSCWISAIGSREELSTPKIIIQSHTHIGIGATISAVRKIILEKHVLLAKNVYISDHGHAFEDVTTPIMFQGVAGIAEVRIGEHTWIGQNACVMPGVRIGKHCVIGANSVVTRDVADFSVAVGAPARVIKKYDAQTRRWEKTGKVVPPGV